MSKFKGTVYFEDDEGQRCDVGTSTVEAPNKTQAGAALIDELFDERLRSSGRCPKIEWEK